MQTYLPAIFAGLILGIAVGYIGRHIIAVRKKDSIERRIKERLEEAESKAKEIILDAKDRASSFLADAKKEENERKKQIAALENRLIKREEFLDKRLAQLDEGEKILKEKLENLDKGRKEVEDLKSKVSYELEKLSGLSRREAKEKLFEEIKRENKEDILRLLEKLSRENNEQIERKTAEIITSSLERFSRENVSEITTTAFPLPDEELKGKIIGKEGRNIRAIERATGVELVIDETPDSIVISSFDPYRRELAKIALEKLIKDGRIQPAKIEEKVEESREELNKRILELGEEAAMDVGVYDMPKEVLQLLGRLHFRTSYGQNVLDHSIEMAHIAGHIASELGLDIDVAKKAALLHDIGKAIDHDVEGTHVEIGRKILKKYGIDEAVIEAMQSHHGEYPYARGEAYIVTAADVLSASRPGARRDTLENYIKRLSDLEKIAMEFSGVKQAYAVSGGKELRVFVVPEKIDDFKAFELAKEIAGRIQSELKYPGEIKVNIIREVRAVEYAK